MAQAISTHSTHAAKSCCDRQQTLPVVLLAPIYSPTRYSVLYLAIKPTSIAGNRGRHNLELPSGPISDESNRWDSRRTCLCPHGE